VVEPQARQRRGRACGWGGRGTRPVLADQGGPPRRVGWALAALAATLRTTRRRPLAQLQRLLQRGWGLRRAGGALSGLLAETARAGRAAYDALLAAARASPVVHSDETGWRAGGRTGYVRTVGTLPVRPFRYCRSRAGAVADRLLGADGTAAVGSDVSGAYDHLDRVQQRCWAHLLRDIPAGCEAPPADHRLQRWAAAAGKVDAKAVAWAERATADGTRPLCRERARDRFAAALGAICRSQPADAPPATRCARIARYRADLFTFVADPAVPPTDNADERALRPLVVARKVSGGTRSTQGSHTRMVLQSLVATWELRGLDPIAECIALLRDPDPPTPEAAPV
jgi:hypothetical protein